MGILGVAFTKASVGLMADVGQSQDNDIFNSLLMHASDVGNVGVTPARKGPGLGMGS